MVDMQPSNQHLMQNYAGQDTQQYGRINMSMNEEDYAYRGGALNSSSSELPHYNMNQMPDNFDDINKIGGRGFQAGYQSSGSQAVSGLRKRNV